MTLRWLEQWIVADVKDHPLWAIYSFARFSTPAAQSTPKSISIGNWKRLKRAGVICPT
jgi:hypothetical protein